MNEKSRVLKDNIFSMLITAAIVVYGIMYCMRFFIWRSESIQGTLVTVNRVTGVIIDLILLIFVIKEAFAVIRDIETLVSAKKADLAGAAVNDKYAESRMRLFYALSCFVVFMLMYPYARILTAPLLIYFSKEISFRRRMQLCIIIYVFMAVFWAAAFFSGKLGNEISVFGYGTFSSFGLVHANKAGRAIVFALLAWWYVYGRKRMMTTGIVSIICAAVSWFIFGCRTAAVSIVLFLIIILIFEYKGEEKEKGTVRRRELFEKAGNIFFTALPFIMLLGSIAAGWVIVYVIGQGRMLYFGRRFIEMIYAFREYGLSLFPRDMTYTADSDFYYYLDNTYTWMLYRMGMLCTAGYMIWMCMAGNKAFKYRTHGFLPLVFIVFLYAVMEQSGTHFMFLMIVSIMNLPVTRRLCLPQEGNVRDGECTA